MSVASKLSPALKKAAEASRSRILARVQAAVGADSFAMPADGAKASLGEHENDPDVGREVRALWNAIENLSARKPAPLSDIPQSFLENPRTDYEAYKKMATAMRADTPLAGRWLAAIERAEKYEKETDEVDPGLEDSLVNALIPLQRTLLDAMRMADTMAVTSQQRIAELEKALIKCDHDIDTIDDVTIYDLAAEHPEWEADAARRVAAHDWNMIQDEPDKDDHSAHDDHHGDGKAKAH